MLSKYLEKVICPYCRQDTVEKGRTGDYDGQPDNDFYCWSCDDYFDKDTQFKITNTN